MYGYGYGYSGMEILTLLGLYNATTNKAAVIMGAMQATADKLGKFSSRDPNSTYGYGVINIDAIVKLLLNAVDSTVTTANFAETHDYSHL